MIVQDGWVVKPIADLALHGTDPLKARAAVGRRAPVLAGHVFVNLARGGHEQDLKPRGQEKNDVLVGGAQPGGLDAVMLGNKTGMIKSEAIPCAVIRPACKLALRQRDGIERHEMFVTKHAVEEVSDPVRAMECAGETPGITRVK